MSGFSPAGTNVAHANRSVKNPNRPGRTPKASEVKALREAAGLTQLAASNMVYVSLRAWQQWESETEGDSRKMPPATWQLFRLKCMARGDQAVDAIGRIFEELREGGTQ